MLLVLVVLVDEYTHIQTYTKTHNHTHTQAQGSGLKSSLYGADTAIAHHLLDLSRQHIRIIHPAQPLNRL